MNPWMLPSCGTFLLVAWLILFVFERRPPPPMWPALPAALFTLLVFATGDVLTFLVTDPSLAWAPVAVLYSGVIFLPPACWILVNRFAEAQGVFFAWSRSPWLRAPLVVSALFWLAMMTNPWHGEFLTNVVGSRNEYHWLWRTHTVYAYVVLFSTIALYARLAFRARTRLTRARTNIILLAIAVNVVANLGYVLSPSPMPFDPTTTAFCVTAALFTFGAHRAGFFALSPVAMTTLLHRQPDGILVADPAGNLLYWNPAAELAIGGSGFAVEIPVHAYLAKYLRDPDEPSRPMDPEAMREMLTKEEQPPAGHVFRSGPDGERWLHIRVAPIFAARGRMIGRSLLIEDHTPLHEANEARKEAEMAVLHAQKLESLGVMAGGIAHDFNNLLVAVVGNASLALAELEANSPLRSHLEDIERAAESARGLTQQLMAYAGKGRFVIGDVDLTQAVHDTAHFFDVSIPKTANIRCELSDALPAVRADRSQIQQIVMNLVTNAAEALGDAPGEITIETGVRELEERIPVALPRQGRLEPGTYVVLSVSDTGCGMSPETVEVIFDPFYSTKSPGRGLGLAATSGIVLGHGAALRVDSTPGAGATFEVYLPAEEHPVRAEAPAADTPLLRFEHRTVLLADDDPTVLRAADRMLASRGHKVLRAEDGVEALEVFDAHRDIIDLAVIDLSMPRLGGLDTACELRSRRPDLPILFSSGYPETEEPPALPGDGATAFIQKPYRLAVLMDHVRRVCGP